ncbi:hypothetical protein IAG25_35595 [Caballeronia sp. EK]|uniref:hypothetical protein n=1 Tax=Caballeronia sp. EK TaxID=2767469 RepID=UPI0019C8D2AF|nr:hypothetical protein [Caballeronia sp. EK]MBC8642132.1 hypothetical protein [Caballeronia sp. EK]
MVGAREDGAEWRVRRRGTGGVMAGSPTPFPPYEVPFLGPDGRVNRVWWDFLLTIFNRTGANAGGDLSALKTLLDDVAALLKKQGLRIDELDMQAAALVAIPLLGALARRVAELEAMQVVACALRVVLPALDLVPTHGIQDASDLHAIATATAAGFLSAADKAKLDTLSTPADPNDWAQVAKASLPTAAAGNKGWRRFVTNATGATGIVPAYSDGSAWKRFADDSVVT